MEKNESRKLSSILTPLIQSLHLYGSFLYGWIFFQEGVYPLTRIAPSAVQDVVQQVPLYILHILAFGSLVYLATAPFIHIVLVVLQALDTKK